jgi:PAS domain S-box-containing protein
MSTGTFSRGSLTWEDARGAGVVVLSVAAAVVLTRIGWPLFFRAPFVPLVAAVFIAARWTSEPAALFAIPAAMFGSFFMAPPGDPNAPAWWMSVTFASVAIGVNRLVVGRNRVEIALRASEAQFRAAWDNVAFGVALLNAKGQVERINPAMERVLGYSSKAWAGVFFAYFCVDDAAEERMRFADVMASGGASYQREQRYRRADGGSIWCRVTMSVITGPNGGRRGALMVLEDVTDRRRAEDALRASEHHYRQLFRDNPQAMWVVEPAEQKFLAVNQAALDHYGYSAEEFLRLTVHDVMVHNEAAPLGGRGETHARASGRHRLKSGKLIEVQVDSSVMQWGGRSARLDLVHDVTERTELREQLSQSQKMEAIGQLAGGVAHDFNNLLTTIQGYTDLLLTQIGPDKAIWKDLHEIQAASTRAALLTHQLLAFSRRQQFDITAVDVNDVVARLSQMMRRLIAEDIEVDVALGEGRLHARADVSRVEQVLMNLVVNARDAVSGPGGRIVIRTSRVQVGSDRAPGGRASYVALEVIDNGTGMDEATRQRVFEPFFTTKRPGAGTGLGLAMVYGIVQQCGGHIEVESELGKGTTFRVFLPWTGDPVRSARLPPTSPDALVGAEHVLIVEDSTELRMLVSQVLKRHGYQVSEAATPEEALAFTQQPGMSVDLLLMDVVMPRMAGPDVAVHLKAAWPDAGVLYMSGYAHDSLVKRGIVVDESDLMKKPFSAAELLTRIRSVLDHPVHELS